jgi:hypothetical protein
MKKIIGIICFIVFFISVLYSIYIYVFSIGILNMHTNYEIYTDYRTLEHEIVYIQIEEDTIYLDNYFLENKNLEIFLLNNGIDAIKNGDQVSLIVGNQGWGDSFSTPIVMIEKDDIIYLDFDTAVGNLISEYQSMKISIYKSLIAPVTVSSLSLVLGIYLIIKKKTK